MNSDDTASPCVQICQLNAGQVCIGCGRHIAEIAAWSAASDEARRHIRREAAARLAALRTAYPPHSTGKTDEFAAATR